MNFRTWAALAVAAFVVAPLVAHLLRRKPPEEQPFAATRLVPQAPAVASRRTALEDKALFAFRALAIVALAVLGATPLFRCTRLSVARPAGASIALAIVLDDSLSMRAQLPEREMTRLARALDGARDLAGSLQSGDAVALVLAGGPARVALSATTNLDALRTALDSVRPTDRGTDLDGAIGIASELVSGLAHLDKRVVVLSDLESDPGARVAAREGVRVWAPLAELRFPLDDCAVVSADRSGGRVAVNVACTESSAAKLPAARTTNGGAGSDRAPSAADARAARRLSIRAGEEVLVSGALGRSAGEFELAFTLPEGAIEKHATTQLYAVLDAGDAIPEDDAAPVVAQGAELRAAVVADPTSDRIPTGGAPLVERAIRALDLGVQATPMTSVPDQREELEPLALLVVDDAPGFTPEQRRDLSAWLERGGVVLFGLGPRSGAAPLGSGFSPMVPGLVRWRPSAAKGLSPRDDLVFADAFDGLDDVVAKGRAQLELESQAADVEVLARWDDGAPFLVRRALGRGVAYATTLPFSSAVSDFGLRPAMFSLLDRVIGEARSRTGTGRTVVGATWSLVPDSSLAVTRLDRDGKRLEDSKDSTAPWTAVAPERAGLYEVAHGDQRTTRVAAIDRRELLAGELVLPENPGAGELGGAESERDVSPQVALVLLALVAGELAVRAYGRARAARSVS